MLFTGNVYKRYFWRLSNLKLFTPFSAFKSALSFFKSVLEKSAIISHSASFLLLRLREEVYTRSTLFLARIAATFASEPGTSPNSTINLEVFFSMGKSNILQFSLSRYASMFSPIFIPRDSLNELGMIILPFESTFTFCIVTGEFSSLMLKNDSLKHSQLGP